MKPITLVAVIAAIIIPVTTLLFVLHIYSADVQLEYYDLDDGVYHV